MTGVSSTCAHVDPLPTSFARGLASAQWDEGHVTAGPLHVSSPK